MAERRVKVEFRDRRGRFVSPGRGKRQYIRMRVVDTSDGKHVKVIRETDFERRTAKNWRTSAKRAKRTVSPERLKSEVFTFAFEYKFFQSIVNAVGESGLSVQEFYRSRSVKGFSFVFNSPELEYQVLERPGSTLKAMLSTVASEYFRQAWENQVRVSSAALVQKSRQEHTQIDATASLILYYS